MHAYRTSLKMLLWEYKSYTLDKVQPLYARDSMQNM